MSNIEEIMQALRTWGEADPTNRSVVCIAAEIKNNDVPNEDIDVDENVAILGNVALMGMSPRKCLSQQCAFSDDCRRRYRTAYAHAGQGGQRL